MSLSDTELQKLSKLTAITIDPEEKQALQEKLDTIIGFLSRLQQIDTTDVAPLTHPIAGHTLSVDEIVPPTTEDSGDYLANVKHRIINNAIKIKSMI